jgi:diguanylate cyclase (GGDEF)-like protein
MDLATFQDTYRAGSSLPERNALLLAFAEESMQSHPDELWGLLDEARTASRAAGLTVDEAFCNRLLGWIAFDRADYTEAEDRFAEAAAVFRSRDHNNGLVKCLNGISSVYLARGNLESGLRVFREALALAESVGDRNHAMVLQANMGQNLVELGLFDEAVGPLTQALDSGLLSPLNQALTLTQWARACIGLGRDDEARKALHLSIDLARTGRFTSSLAESLGLLGALETKGHHGPSVEALLEEARTLAATVGDRATEARATIDLGALRLVQDRPHEALGLFRRSTTLAQAIGAQRLEAESLQNQAEVAAALGEWREAYHTLDHFHQVSDRIRNEAANKQLDQIRSDQAQRETALLREQSRVLALLGDLGQRITASLELGAIVNSVYEEIGGLMHAESFGLGLYDEERQIIDFRLFIDNGTLVQPFEAPLQAGTFSGWCIRHRESILLNDIETEYPRYMAAPPARFGHEGQSIRSCLYTPLLANGQVLGVLSAQSTKAHAYTDRDLATLKTLAGSISIAVQNARLFDQVTRLATVDELTGAVTRRRLFERAEEEFQRFRRDQGAMALVMVDLDHFKAWNDTWGHATGDRVLADFGRMILREKRPHDLFGRYGGEEFALVLSGTDLDGALTTARRLCQLVRQLPLSSPEGEPLQLTASFGVTVFDPSDKEITKVFSRADEALYEAKQAGRDRVVARTV